MKMSFCLSCITDSSTPASCIIQLLDHSDLRLPIRKTDSGSVLLDKVCGHLDLYERDYFGLRFFNASNKTSYWLDVQKNVLKQLKRHGVTDKKPRLYFGVKFYAIDPCGLKEELTRYLVFLQLRSDVSSGRIPTSFDTQAELGALAAQAEFGDYNPQKHFAHYTDSLMLSESTISAELEDLITKLHKTKFRGLLASQCEMKYLDLVSRQSLYGVQLYNVKGVPDNKEYQLGVSPHGLAQHSGKAKLAVFAWPMIDSINFKHRELRLTVQNKQDTEPKKYVFRCMSTRACKQIWKASLEHHTFFRLTKTTSPESKPNLFQLGSKHRYSGRTVKELATDASRKNQPQVRRNSLRSSQIRNGPPLSDTNTASQFPNDPNNASQLASHNDASHLTNQINNASHLTNHINNAPPHSTSSHPNHSNTSEEQNGLFTAGRNSPESVNNIRLKFPTSSSSTDMMEQRVRNKHRNGRSSVLGSDSESIMSARSHARSSVRTHNQSMANYQAVSDYSDMASLQPSAERIVSSYTKHNRGSDRWRHNGRTTPNGPKPYENITYDEYGKVIIEPSPEMIPYYQQNWLEENKHRDYDHIPPAGAASYIETRSDTFNSYTNNGNHTRTNFYSANQRQDNNYRSRTPQPAQRVKSSQSSLGFYEDKLINRDSGTDSPTYYPTEDYYTPPYSARGSGSYSQHQLTHSQSQYNSYSGADHMYI